jgi:hypothetical protein
MPRDKRCPEKGFPRERDVNKERPRECDVKVQNCQEKGMLRGNDVKKRDAKRKGFQEKEMSREEGVKVKRRQERGMGRDSNASERVCREEEVSRGSGGIRKSCLEGELSRERRQDKVVTGDASQKAFSLPTSWKLPLPGCPGPYL